MATKCKLCKKELDQKVMALPIKDKDSLTIIVCEKCGKNSSAYCKKHNEVHLGFLDDTGTVCASCIKEIVDEEGRYRKEEIKDAYSKLRRNLPEEEFNRLFAWADCSVGDRGESPEVCIFWAIVAKSLRYKVNINEIIRWSIRSQSVNRILPKIITV